MAERQAGRFETYSKPVMLNTAKNYRNIIENHIVRPSEE